MRTSRIGSSCGTPASIAVSTGNAAIASNADESPLRRRASSRPNTPPSMPIGAASGIVMSTQIAPSIASSRIDSPARLSASSVTTAVSQPPRSPPRLYSHPLHTPTITGVMKNSISPYWPSTSVENSVIASASETPTATPSSAATRRPRGCSTAALSGLTGALGSAASTSIVKKLIPGIRNSSATSGLSPASAARRRLIASPIHINGSDISTSTTSAHDASPSSSELRVVSPGLRYSSGDIVCPDAYLTSPASSAYFSAARIRPARR